MITVEDVNKPYRPRMVIIERELRTYLAAMPEGKTLSTIELSQALAPNEDDGVRRKIAYALVKFADNLPGISVKLPPEPNHAGKMIRRTVWLRVPADMRLTPRISDDPSQLDRIEIELDTIKGLVLKVLANQEI